MAMAFQRTLRCLEREQSERLGPRLLLMAAVFGAWTAWLVCARVPVYAMSQRGRLEVRARTHRAAAASGGKVVRLALELGVEVEAGQLLLQLDDSLERKKLDEAEAQVRALSLRERALRAQLRAESDVQVFQARAAEGAENRAEVAVDEAGQSSLYRERLQRIADQLHREELISHIEALQSEQELAASRMHVSAAQADLLRQRADGQYARALQTARVAALTRELADLSAQRVSMSAAVDTARAQLERRVVRAPLAGRIGSVAALQIGDVVREGDLVATVIPPERLRVVAEFSAADALGRVKPGQAARVRLSGFPLLEFGTLGAVVKRVASEPERGSVRVELSLADNPHTHLPLQHGVPGVVEVRIESAAPWRMLMRGLSPQRTAAAQRELARDVEPRAEGSAG
jgi:membrane fusion protein (multidrug efflux system)